MFLEGLINQTNGPLLERVLDFTSARHQLIAQNMANIDVVGYQQKDLNAEKFYGMLQERVDQKRSAGNANFDDVPADLANPTAGILFHDGNNRSIEQLAADQAKNEAVHNLVVELLRKQYSQLSMALSEKVS
jgi:flagellar basal-body rod protein FlgB